MNGSAHPRTARERDRALARIRSITTGTAVVATMATAGFGTLAAFTWSGTSTDNPDAAADGPTINTTVAQVDPDDDGDVDATDPATLDPGATMGAAATARPLQPTPTPVTSTKKKSRVTSGGSG